MTQNTVGASAYQWLSDPSTFLDMVARGKKIVTSTPAYVPMNALSRLIHRRKEELELSWYDIADRGGFSSHTIAYALAKKAEHRQPPRGETLTRLAKALDLPLDVVKAAAAEAAGYQLESVQVDIEAAEDVRVIADVMSNLSATDRAKLRRLALAFLTDAQQGEQNLTPEQLALRANLSEAATKVAKLRTRSPKKD
jgi:transcriptional regulator with XRE-family HTH domain